MAETNYDDIKPGSDDDEFRESGFDLADLFRYHEPSERGKAAHTILSLAMTEAAEAIDATCMGGFERSVALQKLQEVKFWASAAVARDPRTR